MGQVNTWQTRQVLITGGTGMLGCALARILHAKGAMVHLLSKSGSASSETGTWHQGNIENIDDIQCTLTPHRIDTVFHLAAQSQLGEARQSPLSTFETNIRGTWNLLEAVRNQTRPISVIVASSVAVASQWSAYRNGSPDAAVLEPYSSSKICSEIVAKCYHDSYQIPVCNARLSNLYGPADTNPLRLVPETISTVLQQRAPKIRSNGQVQTNYLYVDDAANALIYLVEHMQNGGIAGKSFTINNFESIKVIDMVRTILQVMERTDLEPEILGSNPTKPTTFEEPENQLHQLYDWTPKVSLHEGLAQTINWYRIHGI